MSTTSVVDKLTPFEDRICRVNLHYSREEWRKWANEAIPHAREIQARLMSNVDYKALRTIAIETGCGIASEMIPMLWPLDDATFPYANNRAAKNTAKPGDLFVCPAFSVPFVVLRLLKRNGKKQDIEVLRGPEFGKFYWHADHNNLFFRCLTKRDAKKLGVST